MVDPVIAEFLSERIKKRIEFKSKELIKKNDQITDEEKSEIEAAALEEYELKNWLYYCAKNAHGISLTTHPCKYSHPDANSSTIYFNSDGEKLGYLLSSSVDENEDVIFSTAAYMPIYSFLKLKLNDGKEILDHLVHNTEAVKDQFSILESYDSIRTSLLKVRENDSDVFTDEKIKQVFFPVSDEYHLLSIVSSSVNIFKLKQKLKEMNSFKENEDIRKAKKNNEYHYGGYKEIFNLTLQGHVKSNPQCISQLNKDNFGETFLLHSAPPILEKRLTKFPKNNFFGESFRYIDCRYVFAALHKILKTDYNNINIREGLDYRIQELMDRIIDKMWAVRSVSENQYHADSSSLKGHQKIWLCHENIEKREEADDWLEALVKEITRWLILTYEKINGKQTIKLGEKERLHILKIITQNKEALR